MTSFGYIFFLKKTSTKSLGAAFFWTLSPDFTSCINTFTAPQVWYQGSGYHLCQRRVWRQDPERGAGEVRGGHHGAARRDRSLLLHRGTINMQQLPMCVPVSLSPHFKINSPHSKCFTISYDTLCICLHNLKYKLAFGECGVSIASNLEFGRDI